MKAVVMAGGEGSRLRPATGSRPKPLVPVGNEPIMAHILRHLRSHGITEVVATLHYLAHEIQGTFGDGSEFDLDLAYSVEETPLGTAGSVKQAEAMLEGDSILIVSGDALTDCDLTAAYAFHKANKSLATLILYRVPNPLDFGVVITDEGGRIQRFLEKPSWSEVFSDTVNTGMYILEPEVLEKIEAGQPSDWSQDIFPRLLAEGAPIFGYVMDGYWADIGSLAQYREAQADLISRKVRVPLSGDEILPGVYAEPNCTIDPSAIIKPPVLLGRHCKIKANAVVGPYTVLGDHALVEEGAIVERSVVWESAYIGPGAHVHSAICCSRVTIKKDCDVQEDAVIGDRCLLDVGAVIRPRVKIWPDKVVERGSVLTMSLIWGNKWRGNLFRELGVAGLSNIEITPDFATRLGAAFGSVLPPKSQVISSRDSTRSSRMIKRAVMSALLGAGCDVLDLHGAAVPIVRHAVRCSGAAGAVHVRKLPGNSRVTLVEFYDSNGSYISRSLERKVESAFSREDFSRTDPDDLGMIHPDTRAVENYQTDFMARLGPDVAGRKLRVVCDYGYSPIASLVPQILVKLNVESISLHTVNDAKRAPRNEEEIWRHTNELREIVNKLGYDLGVLFYEEGERMAVVDDLGQSLQGNELLAVLSSLIAAAHRGAAIGLSLTAPMRLEKHLRSVGVQVVRTKADTRSLMTSSLEAGVTFAGDDEGGFIFPEFHPGFDAMFTFAKLIRMLQQTGEKLSDVASKQPEFALAYDSVRCPWEQKGAVMRSLAEQIDGSKRVEMVDGIKIHDEDKWVLILPDALEPLFHLYAESNSLKDSQLLVDDYRHRIDGLVGTVQG
jgi:mannose-1-phosphate guanylyltransferase/phosphomannomutase